MVWQGSMWAARNAGRCEQRHPGLSHSAQSSNGGAANAQQGTVGQRQCGWSKAADGAVHWKARVHMQTRVGMTDCQPFHASAAAQ